MATRSSKRPDAPVAAFPVIFRRAFPQLRDLHERFTEDGVLIAAAWEGGRKVRYCHLPVRDGIAHAIIGGHRRCDLQLPQGQGASLRHVAVAARRVGLADVRLHVWELASGIGVRTEHGLQCEALVSEGVSMFSIGACSMFAFPTGGLAPYPWAPTARDTWNGFPERVCLDLRVPTQSGPMPVVAEPAPDSATENSLSVTRIVPPAGALRAAPRGVRSGCDSAGRLRLETTKESLDIPVTAAELDRGVLIGRYGRCQLGANLPGLSRIHLLVVRDGARVWAFDAASTNGTTHRATPIRQVCLANGAELSLGNVVTLRWEDSLPTHVGDGRVRSAVR